MAVANLLDSKAVDALSEVSKTVAQTTIDGERNVWILKPAHSSRGKGD